MLEKDKLKTLKEIKSGKTALNLDEPIDFSEAVFKSDLRQEAIKWVKELSKKIELVKTSPEHYREYKESSILKSNADTINWIMNFFNLTEEDLKC